MIQTTNARHPYVSVGANVWIDARTHDWIVAITADPSSTGVSIKTAADLDLLAVIHAGIRIKTVTKWAPPAV